MNAPRRTTAAFIAFGILSLSCGLTPPASDVVAEVDPYAYEAFASSEAAQRVAETFAALHTGLLPAELSELSAAIAAESSRAELPLELVLAVIQVESSGYNFAVSPVGAMGLMQLLPSTGEAVARRIGMRWTGPSTLFDPVSNIRLGVVYLRELVDRYGSVTTALAAYNWGPSRIAERLRRGESIPAIYAQRVMSVYQKAKAKPLQI